MLFVINLHDRVGNFGPARPLLYPLLRKKERLVEITPTATSLSARVEEIYGRLFNHIRYMKNSAGTLIFIVPLDEGGAEGHVEFHRCLADIRFRIQKGVIKRLFEQNIEFERSYIVAVDNNRYDEANDSPLEKKSCARWELDCKGYTEGREKLSDLFTTNDIQELEACWEKPQFMVEHVETTISELPVGQKKFMEDMFKQLLGVVGRLADYKPSLIDDSHFLNSKIRKEIVGELYEKFTQISNGSAHEAINYDPVKDFRETIQTHLSLFRDIDSPPQILRMPAPPTMDTNIVLYRLVSLILTLYEQGGRINLQKSIIHSVDVKLDEDKLSEDIGSYYTRLLALKKDIEQRLNAPQNYSICKRGTVSEITIRDNDKNRDEDKKQVAPVQPKLTYYNKPTIPDLDKWSEKFRNDIAELRENALQTLEGARSKCTVPEKGPEEEIPDISSQKKSLQREKDKLNDELFTDFVPWNPFDFWEDDWKKLKEKVDINLESRLGSGRRNVIFCIVAGVYYLFALADHQSLLTSLPDIWSLPEWGKWIAVLCIPALVGVAIFIISWICSFFRLQSDLKKTIETIFSNYAASKTSINNELSKQIAYLNKYCASARIQRELEDLCELDAAISYERVILSHHEDIASQHITFAEQIHRSLNDSPPEPVEKDFSNDILLDPEHPAHCSKVYQLVNRTEGTTYSFQINISKSANDHDSVLLTGIGEIIFSEDLIYRRGGNNQ